MIAAVKVIRLMKTQARAINTESGARHETIVIQVGPIRMVYFPVSDRFSFWLFGQNATQAMIADWMARQ